MFSVREASPTRITVLDSGVEKKGFSRAECQKREGLESSVVVCAKFATSHVSLSPPTPPPIVTTGTR